MSKREGVRCAATWLLLAAGAMAFASWASPISPGPRAYLRDAPHLEGAAPNDFGDRLTPVWEATQEVRRTGPGISPNLLGIDEAFLGAGSMLHGGELRGEISDRLPGTGRPGSVRKLNTGDPDIIRDTLNSALMATRDAFFEGSDTASFSLAGIDLSVSLRGDRRGVWINGYELLAGNHHGAQGEDVLPPTSSGSPERKPGAHPASPAGQYADDGPGVTLEEIRKFVSDPMTIVGMLAFLGIWGVVATASSRAQGN